jgi:hypothetical protein
VPSSFIAPIVSPFAVELDTADRPAPNPSGYKWSTGRAFIVLITKALLHGDEVGVRGATRVHEGVLYDLEVGSTSTASLESPESSLGICPELAPLRVSQNIDRLPTR